MNRTTFAIANARHKPKELLVLNTNKILWFTVLHIGLALLIDNFRFAATIHALLVFALGLWTALTSEDIRKVIPYVAYIAGAEVLWRMSNAGVFWEFGKYATIAILVIALIKNKTPLKKSSLPILYFLMFLPSIILTIDFLGWTDQAREFISFNLSGPLATAVCLLFFLQVNMDESLLTRSIWAVVFPIVGILTLAVYSTITATAIDFGSEAVFVTSGGYGPNQVAALLGLGALLLIMEIIQTKKREGRIFSIFLILALLIQSFLTFSRGGVYNLVIALAAALVILLFKPTRFIKSFSVVFLLLLIVGYLVFPQIEEMTSGAFSQRFQDINPVSRISIANEDLKLFNDNPLYGVGPGMAYFARGIRSFTSAHTEYTRTLAEHGTLGIFALLFLVIQIGVAFIKAPGVIERAWIVALAGWSAVEMAHAAMRVVAISLLLGLAVVSWKHEEPEGVSHKKSGKRIGRFRLR